MMCSLIRSKGFDGIATSCRQSGLTIVELMISMALGLVVILAVTGLLLSTQSSYAMQDENARLQDTARHAVEIVSRSVRQAAYVNWDKADAPIAATAIANPNIAGLDARGLKSTTPGIDAPVSAVNGSDVLALRFYGAGDGSILNCAGFAIPAPASLDSADEDRGWSIFHVAKDKSGEPELHCKYHGASGWTSDAIARGVESFQVLYGVDTDDDGLPNRFISADAVDELDNAMIPAGQAANPAEKNRRTYWKRVVEVKIALLVRGSQDIKVGAAPGSYDLFGAAYSESNKDDTGTHIDTKKFPAEVRNRMRKVVTWTIPLRNPPG